MNTLVDSRAIGEVDEPTYARVIKQIELITSSEQHFNNIEVNYRQLASTWLLATFAGIGFCLTKDTGLRLEREWIIAGIAFAGTIGILLLWVLDMLAYHQLLGSFFAEGIKFEERYRWLPPIRQGMMESQHHQGVMRRVVGFYAFPCALLISLGFGAVGYAAFPDQWRGAVIIAIIGVALALAVVLWMFKRMREAANELYKDTRFAQPKALSGAR